MAEVKVTKREMYEDMFQIFSDMGPEYQAYADFCEKEINSLIAKAEKAKERAAKKRAEGDEYKAIVASALSDELQTGAAIYELVGDENFSIGKVRARLTALVREGTAVKQEVKQDGHTVMAYRLA